MKSLVLLSLEKMRLKLDLITACSFFKRGKGGEGIGLCSLVTTDRTRGNGLKLIQEKFSLDIRKRFFTQRVIGNWSRFPRDVVTALSLAESKKSWKTLSGT